MKILSGNVRGLGRPEKRGKIKRLVRERDVDVLFLQETKRRNMEDHFVKSVWPYKEMEFMVVDAVGSAGVNIYAPNEVLGRRQLWESLVGIHQHFPNPWCVGGDFNEIRFMGERKGCLSRDRRMKDFNDFVEKLELTDMALLGKQYTWCNAMDGNRWSRIDRFLLDVKWMEKFSFKQWEVKKRWEEAQVQGWAGFRVMRKLNLLRSNLREWNKVVFGNIDTQLKKAEEELHEWDLKAESRSLEEEELNRRREVRS
ncbi:uncharacterized protein LOC114284569 [Camellia sinensis]|uniref:uncharacterized protein LOC114284569 n=1 Tax=Camellia sinensis TaxID=4442 RepID=UPI0010365DC5|nr:uncharacterized protein LOC114284569 [Camellia sinensis]